MSALSGRKPSISSLAPLGLSLALTVAFNANAAESLPVAAAQATNTQQNHDQEQLDQKLAQALNETAAVVSAQYQEAGFAPLKDRDLQQRIDNLKTILQSGASPNHYVPDTLLMESGNLSPIGIAILIAAKTQRPDLVQAFIDKGANVRLRTTKGWGPMDYAVATLLDSQGNPNNLAPSRAEVETAIKIIKILDSAGLRPTDATALTKGSSARTKNYATLGIRYNSNAVMQSNGFLMREIMHEQGLLNDAEYEMELKGNRKKADALLNSQGITNEMLKANGGSVNETNTDTLPGKPEMMRAQAGSTIMSMARRFVTIMGATSADQAVAMIAAANKIAISKEEAVKPLAEIKELLIPVLPENQIGVKHTKGGESVRDIAEQVKDIYYIKGASTEQIALDIARMNGIDATDVDNKQLLNAADSLILGLENDSYSHLSPLSPPTGAPANRKVDLMIVEAKDIQLELDGEDSGDAYHVRNTYSVAVNTAYAVNRRADMERFHSVEDTLTNYPAGQNPEGLSNVLRILMNAAGTPLRDRLVFSVSEAARLDGSFADRAKSLLNADNVVYEGVRLMLGSLGQSKPAIFASAGNFRIKEGAYTQSRALIHSPRSTLVGAAGKYGTTNTIIGHYSSYFADICAREPVHQKQTMQGTSFTTPLVASLDRQFLEWYGDRLSFEEIKAAGLMTATRDILDFDDPVSVSKQAKTDVSTAKTHAAVFNTNGGGLPHNTFCGAGVIDAAQWKKNLDVLLTLKRPGQDAEGQSLNLSAGTAVVKDLTGDKKEYTYKIRVPQDMTLGRLTFMLPQNREERGEVVVKTPAGFEMQMPHALTDIVSTDAFSYEDVHAGDIIEIRTNYPLGDTAGMVLRGHAPGNAIAMLRDKLRTEGTLPAPLKEMEGNRVVRPSKPVTVLRDEKVTWPGINPN